MSTITYFLLGAIYAVIRWWGKPDFWSCLLVSLVAWPLCEVERWITIYRTRKS